MKNDVNVPINRFTPIRSRTYAACFSVEDVSRILGLPTVHQQEGESTGAEEA
jgi:hypothetical protein